MDCNALQWCSKLEIKTQISEDDDEKARCSFGNGELVTFYRRWCFGDSVQSRWWTSWCIGNGGNSLPEA